MEMFDMRFIHKVVCPCSFFQNYCPKQTDMNIYTQRNTDSLKTPTP